MGYVTTFKVLCDTLSQCLISGASVCILRCLHLYLVESQTLFLNGCQFKILLHSFKLASLNSFGSKNSFDLSTQNEISQANFNNYKRIQNWQPFMKRARVYTTASSPSKLNTQWLSSISIFQYWLVMFCMKFYIILAFVQIVVNLCLHFVFLLSCIFSFCYSAAQTLFIIL